MFSGGNFYQGGHFSGVTLNVIIRTWVRQMQYIGFFKNIFAKLTVQ